MYDQVTRRQSLRLIGGGAFALAVPFVLPMGPARAGISWCRTDPNIAIGGRETNSYVARDASQPNSTTVPIQLTIAVPTGSSTAVLASDNGFGHGYVITFVESNSLSNGAIRIQCVVPARDNSLMVQLTSVSLDPTGRTQDKRSTANSFFSLLTHI